MHKVQLIKRIYITTSMSYEDDKYLVEKSIELPYSPILNISLILHNHEEFFIEALTQKQSGSWIAYGSHEIIYYEETRELEPTLKKYLENGWQKPKRNLRR